VLLVASSLPSQYSAAAEAAAAAEQAPKEEAEADAATADGAAAESTKPTCLGMGIDLGTTFSAVSICYEGVCEVIKNEYGNSITPSVVHYDAQGHVTVGEPAEQMEGGTKIQWAKNFIGRRFKDVGTEAELVDYKVGSDADGNAVAIINGKQYQFWDISSQVLNSLANNARNYIKMRNFPADVPVDNLKFVITVPAYFNHPLRKDTKKAGHALDVLRLLSEPVAASFYGLEEPADSDTALVVDLGGGTIDITVMKVEDGLYRTLATTGDLHIGGHKFDMLIAQWLREKSKDTVWDETALLKQAEAIKIELTHNQIADTKFGPFSRPQFNKMMAPYKQRVYELIKEAISRAELEESDISTYFLVGGSSVMPIWREMIKEKFGKEAVMAKDPDHSVTLGAATLAAQLCNHGPVDKVMISNLAFGYGVSSLQGTQEVTTFIAEANVPVPAKYKKVFSTAQDWQRSVTVQILQGFSQDVSKNTHVGTIQYDGLPSRRAGQVEVEVEFQISEEQIMTARVKGLYPGAEIKEEVLTLQDSVDANELERRKEEAKEQAERFSFIIFVEGALSEAKYAIESTLTRDSIEESHRNFIRDLLSQWDKLKNSQKSVEEMKEEFEPKLKEAEPILNKIREAKTKAVTAHDESMAQSDSQASSSSSTSSTAAPDDL